MALPQTLASFNGRGLRLRSGLLDHRRPAPCMPLCGLFCLLRPGQTGTSQDTKCMAQVFPGCSPERSPRSSGPPRAPKRCGPVEYRRYTRDDQGLDGNGEARRHLRGRGLCSEEAGGSAHLWVVLASQLVVEVVVAADNG